MKGTKSSNLSKMNSQSGNTWFIRVKPFIAVASLQVGIAVLDILCMAALNKGMSSYVLVAYRHGFATLVIAPFAVFVDNRASRPKMTTSIFIKILVLSLLEPVIDQNLYFLGMKQTTATFAVAISNTLPAITFILACIVRLETVKIRSVYSQAKVVGTIVTVAGAMVMTLIKGPLIDFPWTRGQSIHDHQQETNGTSFHDSIKGAVMITIGSFCWASFMILQAITLKTYPAELSLTAWICLLGTIGDTIVALVMERKNLSVWYIKWDIRLIAAMYSGIVGSGLAYYIQGVVMKDRGPVFVTAFSPLCMVVVAVMSTAILAEQMFLGRVIGAIIIVAGLNLVFWGKSKDYGIELSPCSIAEEQNDNVNETSNTITNA